MRREEPGRGGTASGRLVSRDPAQSRRLRLQRGTEVGAAAPCSPHPGLPRSVQTRRALGTAPHSSPRSRVAEGLDRPPRITHSSARKGQASAGFSWLHRQPRQWPESGAGSPDVAPEGRSGAAAHPEPRVPHGPRAAAPGGCPSRHPQKAPQHNTPFMMTGPSGLSNRDRLPRAVSKGGQTLRESGGASAGSPRRPWSLRQMSPWPGPTFAWMSTWVQGLGRHRVTPCRGVWGRSVLGAQACRVLPLAGVGCVPPLAFAPWV